MKNTINYYYNLIPQNIHQKDSIYRFSINDSEFTFMPFYGDINALNETYFFLCTNNIFCNEIIINKDGVYFTLVDNVPYILIKNKCNDRSEVTLANIINYNIPITNTGEKKYDWKFLWTQKLDYYEYQINQYGKKYPFIRESFCYYDGLSEIAISLLNLIDFREIKYYVNHKRITPKTTLTDFYNPVNLIIDSKVRDATEYFKMKFFEKKLVFSEIQEYIYISKMTKEEAVLFLARMIYPSYYFDLYDEIIQGKSEDSKLEFYIKNIDNYEMFLKDIYDLLFMLYGSSIPEVEWLKKI